MLADVPAVDTGNWAGVESPTCWRWTFSDGMELAERPGASEWIESAIVGQRFFTSLAMLLITGLLGVTMFGLTVAADRGPSNSSPAVSSSARPTATADARDGVLHTSAPAREWNSIVMHHSATSARRRGLDRSGPSPAERQPRPALAGHRLSLCGGQRPRDGRRRNASNLSLEANNCRAPMPAIARTTSTVSASA